MVRSLIARSLVGAGCLLEVLAVTFIAAGDRIRTAGRCQQPMAYGEPCGEPLEIGRDVCSTHAAMLSILRATRSEAATPCA